MTLECLRSLFAETTDLLYEVLVLDNASTDGSAEAIEAEFGNRIVLEKSNINYGFAGGNNRMASHAKGKYILLLNPDTIVLDGAVQRLVAFAKRKPTAGIWGGRTLFGDHSLNPTSCWGDQTLWTLILAASGLSSLFRNSGVFNPEALGGWDRNGERDVDIVTGCFFLITRELWDTVGGFDETFFMYGEEADLCLRARALGAAPTVTSDATIIHYGGASEKVPADKYIKLLRAKSLLIVRHFPPYLCDIGNWLLSMWPFTRSLAHRILAALGRKPSEENAKLWREVWRRRSEWKNVGAEKCPD